MKRWLWSFAGFAAALLVFSCQSTGQTTGQTTDQSTGQQTTDQGTVQAADSQNEPPPVVTEDQALAQVYEQYESDIILAGARTYTVVKGDTLSRIARRSYGTGDNPYYFPLIIAASKDSVDITDPDLIEVGMELTIPDLQANLDNPRARSNLKNLLKDVADFYARKESSHSQGLYAGLIKLYYSL
jgi:LysM repeat protein